MPMRAKSANEIAGIIEILCLLTLALVICGVGRGQAPPNDKIALRLAVVSALVHENEEFTVKVEIENLTNRPILVCGELNLVAIGNLPLQQTNVKHLQASVPDEKRRKVAKP